IGINVTLDQLDPNHYDLMASEARLASYLAIVKRDVPERHWYALGRPMTRVAGAPALLSWSGTMFEFLMPSLLMRSHKGTLLAQTEERAVEAQIAYGKRTRAPWGISESAYARLDAQQTYQYQAFGVPGLGFKRGLEEDHVVAPYASLLALSLRPRAVLDNVIALESMGMQGTYGLFEALDMHPDRTREGKPFEVVRSYMAHHQGMILVALDNFLNAQTMVVRFHANQLVEAGEMLLNERAPSEAPAEWPIAETAEMGEEAETETSSAVCPWSPDPLGGPQACVWTNGRLSSVLTDSGGGGLRWHGLALTRFEPDATRNGDGMWIYVKDEESGRVWQATSVEGRTTYAVHKAEFHQRDEGISAHVDVVIAPGDDVEVRQITLHNETDRPRSITVTSAAEPVLLALRQAATHPAFSRMFVESERLNDLDALVLTRRPRSADEERATVVHRLVQRDLAVTSAGFETDRAAFFGRLGDERAPDAVVASRGALRGRAGTVIDPIMSLMARVELKPKGTVTLAFVTTVARSRSAAIEVARRYGSMHTVRWAFLDAERESQRRLQRARVEPALLPAVQRLFSALLFAEPTLRSRPEVVTGGRPCKRRLWGRGISGDDPIVLVRVHDAQAPIVRETLAAQRYLRVCGVRVEVVLVDEMPSGYANEGSWTLRNVLTADGADEWLNRHGGVYVLAADQLPDDERLLLEAAARVVLDTRDVSLASRLERPIERSPKQPPFEPTLPPEVEVPPPERPRPRLLFDNGTGGFSEDGKEYVILVAPGATTPAPWCNVLANPKFGCLASESSLGSTWSLNAGENRLTPWRNDPVFDTPSEALYLRDEETAAIWSPTPLPAGRESTTRVHHGAGYSRYVQESHGLEHELTVFVPPDASLKVVRLRLKNTHDRRRRLTATYYAEWGLGGLRDEQRPYIVSELDRARACLLATCHWNAEFGERVAFLASEREVHGFTADRTEFLGRHGDYARPDALERWGLSGRLDPGVDPCAALQVHLELAPGEELVTHFVLGQASDRDEAVSLVDRFRDRAAVDAAWSATAAFWDGLLGSIRVQTPEPSMDLMLNRWLLQQTLSARVFGRTGFYQSSGAFGYRDQLQDVLALLHAAPSLARAHLLEAARHQFEEGDVLHWWHPPSGRGVRTRCSDDMAWLPFVTAEYVSATGDVSVLTESAPFLTAAPLRPDEHDRYAEYEVAQRPASLLEHCRRALERASTEGAHGLPKMGDGDWNDGMNRVGAQGVGESVWLGWFLCATMDRFATLCERVGDGVEAETWRKRSASLGAKIEGCAWDGEWYVRAFHDDGSLVGSAKERECRIDSIAQSWAVLSGAADPKRASQALHAADDRLVREEDRLLLLLWPPFDTTAHDPGYIRAYPPGVRENGGQYTHAGTWLGWAYAKLGDGERAERIFRLLNPVLRARSRVESDRYRVEPYVLAGDVYAATPWVGRGGWSWYTGAAAWTWRLGVEGILGLRKEDGMLRIDPCIPPTWKGFEAWIRMGKQEVHVVVENPDAVSTGVATITLDGAPIDSSRIPLAPDATGTREVRVRLGAPHLPAVLSPAQGDALVRSA
ncbi:MAG TPA: glucoamylase family protein, partial [Polyangiaceae bacterium]